VLEVFDIETSSITHTNRFPEGEVIFDILAINDTHYLLATEYGLLKTSKDQLINQYYEGESVICLCHITDSFYLVGFNSKLRVWDQQKEQEMCHISDDSLDSIKRVMNTNSYILRTRGIEGLKLLTISDLESKKFTIQQLLDYENDCDNLTESLQVLVTPSQIIIAVAQNELEEIGYKGSIKLMKVAIA
jgi:hypothetical protein